MNNNKLNYWVDAPTVITDLITRGLKYITIYLCITIALYYFNFFILFSIFFGLTILLALSFLIPIVWMLYSSKVGKIKVVKKTIQLLDIEGFENILDIGCGRGLFVIESAKKLTTGSATGIDIWQSEDQSKNQLSETLKNIKIANVFNKVKIITADMRKLPFEKNSFDIVVSNLVIHNLKEKRDREKTIHEINRVLKPGGKVAIIDFQYTKEYYRTLHNLGWKNITISGLNYHMFPPTRILFGHKPHN